MLFLRALELIDWVWEFAWNQSLTPGTFSGKVIVEQLIKRSWFKPALPSQRKQIILLFWAFFLLWYQHLLHYFSKNIASMISILREPSCEVLNPRFVFINIHPSHPLIFCLLFFSYEESMFLFVTIVLLPWTWRYLYGFVVHYSSTYRWPQHADPGMTPLFFLLIF